MEDFCSQIRGVFDTILQANGFALIREAEYRVEYGSRRLTARFAYDARERSINFFFGRRGDDVLFDDDVLANGFGSNKKIDQLPLTDTTQNLLGFFEQEGAALIGGDPRAVDRLHEYQNERSRRYTANLPPKIKRS